MNRKTGRDTAGLLRGEVLVGGAGGVGVEVVLYSSHAEIEHTFGLPAPTTGWFQRR